MYATHRAVLSWSTLILTILLINPGRASSVPSPPQVDGDAAFLTAVGSKQVLASRNSDQEWPPASLAKIMTVYTAFHALSEGSVSMDDPVRVSKKAWRTRGSRMFLKVGSRPPLRKILRGIIVASGNDASVALAEHIGGTEKAFVELMNSHAEELGLQHTHFTNASGLPAQGMHTSARDIAHLATALIREFPQKYRLFSEQKISYNGITQHNRNTLLRWDKHVDGVKTGHTKGAQYNLVASAQRNGMRLVAVVLGASSESGRAEACMALLNYGFRFYRTYELYSAKQALHKAPVWQGARDEVEVGLKEPLYITVPRGQREQLDVALHFDDPLIAPISVGTQMGQLTVKLEGETLTERPLIALQRVPEGSWLGQLIDAIRIKANGVIY